MPRKGRPPSSSPHPRALSKRRAVDKVRKAELINISLEMRKDAHTLQEIADRLNCSTSAVKTYLKEGLAALNEMNLELSHAYRDLQVARIEEALKVWRPVSLKVDEPEISLPALDRVIKLETQLVRLVGTENLPVQQVDVEVGVTTGPPVVEFVMPANFDPPEDRTLPPLPVDEAAYITDVEVEEIDAKSDQSS